MRWVEVVEVDVVVARAADVVVDRAVDVAADVGRVGWEVPRPPGRVESVFAPVVGIESRTSSGSRVIRKSAPSAAL